MDILQFTLGLFSDTLTAILYQEGLQIYMVVQWFIICVSLILFFVRGLKSLGGDRF